LLGEVVVEFAYRLLVVGEPDRRHTGLSRALNAHVGVIQEDHVLGRNVKSIADSLIDGWIGLLGGTGRQKAEPERLGWPTSAV
jgi:hypothetical protein